MTAKKVYKLKLQTKEWINKSRVIKRRDNWTCDLCHNTWGIMHTHHVVYTTKNPWDEPDENLKTLCADCHEFVHSYQEDYKLNFYTDERMD